MIAQVFDLISVKAVDHKDNTQEQQKQQNA
jgi:hypothetical protein